MNTIAIVNARGPLGRRILARVRVQRWTTVWMDPSTAPAPRVIILAD